MFRLITKICNIYSLCLGSKQKSEDHLLRTPFLTPSAKTPLRIPTSPPSNPSNNILGSSRDLMMKPSLSRSLMFHFQALLRTRHPYSSPPFLPHSTNMIVSSAHPQVQQPKTSRKKHRLLRIRRQPSFYQPVTL